MAFFAASIGRKISLVVTLLVLAAASIGAVGLWALGDSNRRLGEMYERELRPLKIADELKSTVYLVRGDILDLLLTRTPETRQKLKDEIKEQKARMEVLINDLHAGELSDTATEIISDLDTAATSYARTVNVDFFEAITAGDKETAEDIAHNRAEEDFTG